MITICKICSVNFYLLLIINLVSRKTLWFKIMTISTITEKSRKNSLNRSQNIAGLMLRWKRKYKRVIKRLRIFDDNLVICFHAWTKCLNLRFIILYKLQVWRKTGLNSTLKLIIRKNPVIQSQKTNKNKTWGTSIKSIYL